MPLGTFRVQLSEFDESSNLELEKKLNHYINACGCDTGSYFVIAGILTVIFLAIFDMIDGNLHGVGIAALVIIGFGLVGKTVGLIAARILYFSQIRKVIAKIESLEETKSHVMKCPHINKVITTD